MKRLLAIFPAAENVHLIKDVGMIAYVMHRELNYNSTFACYENGEYDYLQTHVKGLKLIYLQKIFSHPFFDVLFFLIRNARKYDVLQVFQLNPSNLLWCFFFKVLTFWKGKTYLKLYADYSTMQYTASKVVKFFVKQITLVSVENIEYAHRLNQTNKLGREIAHVPNGFYDNGSREYIDFKNKENKIITVGRIGTAQKATEILCEAFATFALSNDDWQLEIIGPIEEDFKSFIITYFDNYPAYKSRVIFTGPIYNREELERHYRSAKIFALTSRYEGFPIVLTEAARFGCYIISTDLPAARDVINDDKYGKVFPIDDYQSLAHILIDTCRHKETLVAASEEIQDFAYQNFYWPEICKNIDALLWKI